MVIVALQIAYLPALYQAFNRRESLVAMLESRAGVPAWGPELLARHQLVGIIDGRAAGQQPRDPGDVCGGQHVGLREHEAVDRVVGGRGPVDQFVDDVGVGPEGQHGTDGPDS